MLAELKTDEQLREALEKCKDFPNHLILHQCIRQLPALSCISFCETPSTEFRSYFAPNRVSRSMGTHWTLCSIISTELFEHGTILVTPSLFTGSTLQSNCKRQAGIEVDETPCSMFYMTTEQMDHVTPLKPTPPDGYSLTRLDPDKHATFISQNWKFAQADETKRTQAKLRHVPTYGVQFDATGELASFALIDDDDTYGSLHNLHTMPEHRRKGLSKVVEIECCKSCIRYAVLFLFKTLLVVLWA
ncbi:Protein T10B10.4 a [Aphelenchoides avenae]|nr:Protein T10B10.4 a [Aphelenchus avenae]